MNGSSYWHQLNVLVKNVFQVRRLKEVKWMNPQACSHEAYTPTTLEHLANVFTHGVWILPALLGFLELIDRASSWSRLVSALVYGLSLLLLFTISTVFHSVHCCLKTGGLKDALHRCDRAMIYVFIAASYFPWLNYERFHKVQEVEEAFFPVLMSTMRILVWVMAAVGILYQQIFHERYKWLETLFYIVMGIGPSVAIVGINEFHDIPELKLGGLAYLLGIIFFKSDGRIPCAHAIWHLFVAGGAGFHYLAILRHLYPSSSSKSSSFFTDLVTYCFFNDSPNAEREL